MVNHKHYKLREFEEFLRTFTFRQLFCQIKRSTDSSAEVRENFHFKGEIHKNVSEICWNLAHK